MPDPDGVRFRARNSSIVRPQTKAESLFDSGKDPSPLQGERFEMSQLFGFAASIAARLTT